MEQLHQAPKKVLRSVITSKGSEYFYLPDGRTQRFKAITNELNDPQDLLVFIPPFDLIKDHVLKLYPSIFTGIENEVQFNQLLLKYAQFQDKIVRPVDMQGIEIKTNSEARQAGRVFLDFIDKKNPQDSFFLPVSTEPKLGYYSFDTRKFLNQQGETMRERHKGNKVTQINFKEPDDVSPLGMH